MTDFDLHAHQRDKVRRLEAEIVGVRKTNATLIRLVAFMLTERFQDTEVDPVEYLQAIVDIDQSRQELGL